jgi:hypothetical protein
LLTLNAISEDLSMLVIGCLEEDAMCFKAVKSQNSAHFEVLEDDFIDLIVVTNVVSIACLMFFWIYASLCGLDQGC